jgi:hypothetical protein
MLLAGIQADLDPRLRHSGVTVLGIASPLSIAIFKEGLEEHEGNFELRFNHFGVMLSATE